MGSTISNCCQAPSKGTSPLRAKSLHPNGKNKQQPQASRLGRRKNVRFIDNGKSINGQKSSKKGTKDSSALIRGNNPSRSDLSSEDGCSSLQAITSYSDEHLSFIEEIKDIKSIFIFDKQIGDGKFGTVFLAHPRADPKAWVAVKLIPQKAFSHRIEKELTLLKSIDHPNIVRYISAYKDKAFFYIVTEYWEGGELFKRIVDQSGMDELEACGVIAKLLSAVKFLHDRNICHRDLKPENILFKRHNDDQIKLIDFGLSKQLEEGEVMKKKLGTPYYLAPEVLEENYGKEVDLWSLGVVAYVLLWGYPPFYGQDAKELFTNIYNVNYEFWDEDWNFISEEARDFISRLLIKDPKERMTIEDALIHPWIVSGHMNVTMSHPEDDLKSNVSDIHWTGRKRLDIIENGFSKSAECTTHDSYDRWILHCIKAGNDLY